MKKLTILFFALILTSVVNAQDAKLHFGLKAAPSLAWLHSSTKGYDSNGSKFGFTYGLITEFKFSDNYAFATGIDVAYRGGKSKYTQSETLGSSTVTSSIEENITLQYIELPLTLKLKTNEIGYLTYYLQAGLAPGINISASADEKMSIQTTNGGSTTTITADSTDMDIKDGTNNFNLSMVIGGGVEYTLSGSTVLLVGLQFNNGFLDVNDDADVKVNSNYLALTVGILF